MRKNKDLDIQCNGKHNAISEFDIHALGPENGKIVKTASQGIRKAFSKFTAGFTYCEIIILTKEQEIAKFEKLILNNIARSQK